MNLKEKLKKLVNQKDEVAKVRSKVENITNGKKPTAYFYKKERQRGEEKQMVCLFGEGGDLVEKPEQIMTEAEYFYTKLYKLEGIDEEQAKINVKLINDKISEEERKKLSALLKSYKP